MIVVLLGLTAAAAVTGARLFLALVLWLMDLLRQPRRDSPTKTGVRPLPGV